MPQRADKKAARRGADLQAAGARNWLQQSGEWPIFEALLSAGWEREENLAVALVARQSPRSGKIGAASFVVDLACLGVKDAFVRLCLSPREYADRVRHRLQRATRMQPASLDLIAKIVAEGEAYARQFGFLPAPELAQARLLLAGARPENCDTPVPLGGPKGTPFFIAGPHDDIGRVIAQLTKAVGTGNFDYLVPVEGPGVELEPGG